MAFLEKLELAVERIGVGEHKVTGMAYVVVDGQRQAIKIDDATMPDRDWLTLGQELDDVQRLVRWIITDGVIRARYVPTDSYL